MWVYVESLDWKTKLVEIMFSILLTFLYLWGLEDRKEGGRGRI